MGFGGSQIAAAAPDHNNPHLATKVVPRSRSSKGPGRPKVPPGRMWRDVPLEDQQGLELYFLRLLSCNGANMRLRTSWVS